MGSRLLAIPTVSGVRALPGLDRPGDVGHPPPGPRQTVQRRCRLLARKLGLEGDSRFVPFGSTQSVPSNAGLLWGLRRAHGPNHPIDPRPYARLGSGLI